MGHPGVLSVRQPSLRLTQWWWRHRFLGAVGVVVLLAGALTVIHRVASGWWFSHSQTLTFTPASGWTAEQTISTGDGSFSISTAPGTNGSTCFRVEASPPPFPAYATGGYDYQCSLLGRGAAAHLDTLIAVGPTFQPSYGLYVAAVGPDVTSISVDTRTGTYDPQTSDYTSATYTARPSGGIALITYPAGDSPLSLTVNTTGGKTESCNTLNLEPLFFAQC
jgi:hypothetical protein